MTPRKIHSLKIYLLVFELYIIDKKNHLGCMFNGKLFLEVKTKIIIRFCKENLYKYNH